MSIPLNIGEGAGKRTKPDCRRYFDIARGSSMECAAALDVCRNSAGKRTVTLNSGDAHQD